MIGSDAKLDWHSPEILAADLLFANLDKDASLYWAVESAGGVERIAAQGDILHAMREPPADTRAWSRTMLLRQAGCGKIDSVNWDEIRLRPASLSAVGRSIRFDDPRRFTRDEMLHFCGSAPPGAMPPPANPLQPNLRKDSEHE